MDNLDPALEPGNPDPAVAVAEPPKAPAAFSWKAQLAPDLANAPSMKKFDDSKDGFNEAVKSHLLLEKLLGYEKVPIPKSKDDTAAWDIFSKAMGIPEKPAGYGLPDVQMPDSMKGFTFDKSRFAEVVHQQKLTPDAASGLWKAYTEMTKQTYAKALKDHEDKMSAVTNQLRGEWGDAYQSKVELGQMVINKFSESKEDNDFITSVLSQDPRGVKFLAKIGDQFAENKIGDFKYQRHSLTPEEIEREIAVIKSDPNHPYSNPKAPQLDHDKAVQYVNNLYLSLSNARKSA